jgi:hypothetical protein
MSQSFRSHINSMAEESYNWVIRFFYMLREKQEDLIVATTTVTNSNLSS